MSNASLLTLKTKHNKTAGFFSNCSVRLSQIINFINKNKELPQNLDSREQFINYKEDPDSAIEDLSKFFFESKLTNKKVDEIDYLTPWQYQKYKNINLKSITPLVEAYFSPSSTIKDIVANLQIKYNIDYYNTCAVYYRGNDKVQESGIAEYIEFFNKAEKILQKKPCIKFLIQTDELEFAEAFKQRFPSSFWFDELTMINHNPNSSVHHSLPRNQRKEHASYFFAAVLIVSKTKHLITYSGNCGLWAVLYRGHAENVYQYLKTKSWKTGEIKKDFGWIS